jgi:phospholipase/lecithinase/hemolysin
VDAFLQQSGGVASPDALYVIEMGSNDVTDAFAVYASGGNGGPILQAALISIATNIQALYGAGARQFFVWSVPNIAQTPALRSLGPAAGVLATQLTVAFNDALTVALAQLSALPGITFARLDAFQLLNAINSDPDVFGLTNVTAACVTPNVPPFACQHPDEFLFWDGIHPTAAGHALLAQLAATVLLP